MLWVVNVKGSCLETNGGEYVSVLLHSQFLNDVSKVKGQVCFRFGTDVSRVSPIQLVSKGLVHIHTYVCLSTRIAGIMIYRFQR